MMDLAFIGLPLTGSTSSYKNKSLFLSKKSNKKRRNGFFQCSLDDMDERNNNIGKGHGDDENSNREQRPSNFSIGRLNEWSSSGGNRELQERLSSELQWAVQKVGINERMDTCLQIGMDRAMTSLDEMYVKGEKLILERNEGLVLKICLGDIGRWNEAVRNGNRVCKEMRGEIRAELETVERMLKAATKKAGRSKDKVVSQRRKVKSQGKYNGLVPIGLMSAVLGIIGLQLFETISKQEHGTQTLVRFGLWSSLPLLILAFMTKSSSSSANSHVGARAEADEPPLGEGRKTPSKNQ